VFLPHYNNMEYPYLSSVPQSSVSYGYTCRTCEGTGFDYSRSCPCTHCRLPNKKFSFFLILASEFLGLSDSLKLLGLNRMLNHQLEHSAQWKMIMSKKLISGISKDSPEDLLKELGEMGLNFDYGTLYNTLRRSQNLLKNPNGENKTFDHWQITEGRWKNTKKGTFRNLTRSFCPSHEWGSLTQTVDVPRLHGPALLLARTYLASRPDCASEGYLKVILHLDSKETETLESEKVLPPQRDEEGNVYSFQCIALKKVVTPSLKRIDFILNGKDRQFWAGYYGPRFGYSECRVIPFN